MWPEQHLVTLIDHLSSPLSSGYCYASNYIATTLGGSVNEEKYLQVFLNCLDTKDSLSETFSCVPNQTKSTLYASHKICKTNFWQNSQFSTLRTHFSNQTALLFHLGNIAI